MIPDITALWVIALLLLCTVLLNTLIFKPILRVMEQRGLCRQVAVRPITAGTQHGRVRCQSGCHELPSGPNVSVTNWVSMYSRTSWMSPSWNRKTQQ